MATVVFVETNFSGLDAILYCKKQGYKTVLVSDSADRFKKWFPESTLYILDEVDQFVSVSDSNSLDIVTAALDAEVAEIDAILTFAEIRTLITAKLAKHYGLRGADPEAIKLAQDKFTFRNVMHEKGVDNVKCQLIQNANDLVLAKDDITFPCFLKPVQGHSSIGAMVCHKKEDVDHVVAVLNEIDEDWISEAYVVEDYLKGELYSVEILTTAPGQHQVVGISDRDVICDSVEIGSSFPFCSNLSEKIEEKACAALDAIGYDFGPSHIEIIAQNNEAHIVEVNVRVGGSGHSIMLALATSRSIVGDYVELCLGSLMPDKNMYQPTHGAAWKCFVSNRPGKIVSLPTEHEIKKLFPIEHFWIHKPLGEKINASLSNYNWIAQVMCQGADQQEAKKNADKVINYVAEHSLIEQVEELC